ncbi:hypothetical protein [Mammaliicoccus sp. Dog046]|uniref:hypothetical protein n=1 Tax=Mammaliicoccus sp. Dog046 TaxID=3034233 RepID=UPI002B260E81|nr:hypothetical protein [Mammaliicoccus sp. Dog046]WQK85650.1 hypothetical protein P3U32_01060 [Mammaliicoccus sp. Dog046]
MKRQIFAGIMISSSLLFAGCSINIGGSSDEGNKAQQSDSSSDQSNSSNNDSSDNENNSNESGITDASNITEQESIAMAMLDPSLQSDMITGDELLSGKYTQSFGSGQEQVQDIDKLVLSESPVLNKMKNKPEGMKFYGTNASKGSYATIIGVNKDIVAIIKTQSRIFDYNELTDNETVDTVNISDLYNKYKDNRKVATVARKIEYGEPMPENSDSNDSSSNDNNQDDSDDSTDDTVNRSNVIDKVESYEGSNLDTDTYTYKEPEKTKDGKWGFSFEDKEGNLAGSYIIDDDGYVTEYDEDGDEVGSGY